MPIINMVYKKKKWWQPWANTLAYLKLEQNTNDSSWKWNNGTGTNITYTTLVTWKKVAYFNGSSKINFSSSLFSSWAFTCSVYVYWTWLNTSSWLNVIMWNAYSDSQWYYSDHHWAYLRSYVNNVWAGVNWYYSNDNRFLLTVTYDGATIKAYKNWTLIATASQSTFSWVRNYYLWYRAYSNDRYWKWYMSDFICENKARTSDEIAKYYNSTKSNYWL